MGNEMINSCRS